MGTKQQAIIDSQIDENTFDLSQYRLWYQINSRSIVNSVIRDKESDKNKILSDKERVKQVQKNQSSKLKNPNHQW